MPGIIRTCGMEWITKFLQNKTRLGVYASFLTTTKNYL